MTLVFPVASLGYHGKTGNAIGCTLRKNGNLMPYGYLLPNKDIRTLAFADEGI